MLEMITRFNCESFYIPIEGSYNFSKKENIFYYLSILLCKILYATKHPTFPQPPKPEGTFHLPSNRRVAYIYIYHILVFVNSFISFRTFFLLSCKYYLHSMSTGLKQNML